MESIKDQAEKLLRKNDRGAHTVPSGTLYPHQWAWDSAFAAIGWAHIDIDRALVELEILLSHQWPDGRIPHIAFDERYLEEYFPGPESWGRGASSTITQPPAWAIALRVILEKGGDEARIRALLPKIESSHLFFRQARDPLHIGAVAVAHPWESGMDNSPAWDLPLSRIDPAQAKPFARVDKGRVGDPAERPSDDDYTRYMSIVEQIRQDDFGIGPFRVYDPMMTSMLIRAEQDVAFIAAHLSLDSEAQSRADTLKSALLKHFWNPETERFDYFDAASEESLSPDVIGAYFPLILEGLEEEVDSKLRDGLKKKFASKWPLPTVALSSSDFNPTCYWRGPTWVNVNWLLAPMLPELRLVESTCDLIKQHGFWEYYHPENGQPLGASEFTWSAALALDLLDSL